MKLQDIPKGSKIKVEEGIITFHHLDGMYSYCTADWRKKEESIIHLSRMTPLKKEGDYYFMEEE